VANDCVHALELVHTSPVMGTGWCGLPWTPWEPLEGGVIRRAAPTQAGIYRVRRMADQRLRLTYIGQTGRALRERLLALARGATADECPFNDPHTAAPYLWLVRHRDGVNLEWSCAPVAGDGRTLRGTEDMLLWRYRIETGLSTEANYGRFYPGYARPTNRWIVRRGTSASRAPGRRALPLEDPTASIDFSSCSRPLCGDGGLLDAPWWQRALLTQFRTLPSGPAVYVIHDQGSAEPAYIGQTSNLQARTATHTASPWPLATPSIAYLSMPPGTPKHELHELESDLLGWHFSIAATTPALQYIKATQ
jgi:hypothetical protein